MKRYLSIFIIIAVSFMWFSGCQNAKRDKAAPYPKADELRNKAILEAKERARKKDLDKIDRITTFQKRLAILEDRNPFTLIRTGGYLNINLSGIIWDRVHPVALIGDDVVGIGEQVGDKRIFRIERDYIELIDDAGNITTLKINEQIKEGAK